MRVYFLRVILVPFLLLTISMISAQDYHKSIKRLTSFQGTEYYPTWSHDGSTIAFTADHNGIHLYTVPAAGGNAVKLTDVVSNHSRFSPDGSYIVFDTEQGTQLMLMPAKGGPVIRIVPDTLKMSRGAHGCWSHDSRKIYFSAEGKITEYELATGKVKIIFEKEGFYARPFSWSSDGKILSADVGPEGQRESDVWLINFETGEYEVVTDMPGREGNPVFSPDGSMVAFMSTDGEYRHLWLLGIATKKLIKISPWDDFNVNPRWSPDGTSLAFASAKEGTIDIYVMELDLKKIKTDLGLL